MNSKPNRMRLDGKLAGRPVLDEELDLTTLVEAWRWRSAENEAGDAGSGGMEITVWWQGGLATASQAAEPNPELVEQLRDLGYLD